MIASISAQEACALIYKGGGSNNASPPTSQELKNSIENGSESERIQAVKDCIALLSSSSPQTAAGGGEKLSLSATRSLLMSIIRFCLPNQKSKFLKKLVLLFFELMPKRDEEGKLLSEVILLCNALRNDLLHPNEYVCGVTLRFLCRIVDEVEILEPLVQSIRQCLAHEHAFVRKNAILCMMSIYRMHPELVDDVPETIFDMLMATTGTNDIICQRNAFIFLVNACPKMAKEYFRERLGGNILMAHAHLQMVAIEFIERHLLNVPIADDEGEENYSLAMDVLLQLVREEGVCAKVCFAAATLLATHAPCPPETIKTIATTLVSLAAKQADNNAKLIILQTYEQLQRGDNCAIVNESVLDVMQLLGSSDMAVRGRALEIIMRGIDGGQSADFIQFVKQELLKSGNCNTEYACSLVKAIGVVSARFPREAERSQKCLLGVLLEIGAVVGDRAEKVDAAAFVVAITAECKALYDANPSLIHSTLGDLLGGARAVIEHVADSGVGVEERRGTAAWNGAGSLFWICGEFVRNGDGAELIVERVWKWLHPLPLLANANIPEGESNDSADNSTKSPPTTTATTKVNQDGIYVTENIVTANSKKQGKSNNLRSLLVSGQALSLTVSISLMFLKALASVPPKSKSEAFIQTKGKALIMITSFIRLAQHYRLDLDSYQRMLQALKVLMGGEETLEGGGLLKEFGLALCRKSRAALESSLSAFDPVNGAGAGAGGDSGGKEITDPINFRLISSLPKTTKRSKHPKAPSNLQMAIFGDSTTLLQNSINNDATRRIVQLTGFSDEMYAECWVDVNHADITLDILLVNQSQSQSLTNIQLDFNCTGDLKIVDKPSSSSLLSLAPSAWSLAKIGVRSESVSDGRIFGCINYGVGTALDTHSIVLAPILLDTCEFIKLPPSSNNNNTSANAGAASGVVMDEDAFRSQWPTLEWENKIIVPPKKNISLSSLLSTLSQQCRLLCITKDQGITETYSATNMTAITIFNEVILVNVCLEAVEGDDGGVSVVSGHLRLRSCSEGVAVAFGDHITAVLAKL